MEDELRFDVYGRFTVALHLGEDGWWVAEAIGSDGKHQVLPQIVIPPDAEPGEIADHLDVLFHEAAHPGAEIRRLQ